MTFGDGLIATSARRWLLHRSRLHRFLFLLLGRGSLEKRIYLSLIRPGDVVFDIGANEGIFTELFSHLTGVNGAVHAFEPVESANEKLRARLALGPRPDNVVVNPIALGDGAGEATIHVPDGIAGQASLRVQSKGAWMPGASVVGQKCRVETLDNYARNVPRLDFVKCDVEGAELLVLRGARETLARCSPILFLEVFDEWAKAFDYNHADLMEVLRGMGYDLLFVAADHVIPPTQVDFSQSLNLLCGKSSMHAAQFAALSKL